MKNIWFRNIIILIVAIILSIVSFYFFLLTFETLFPSVTDDGYKVMPIANILKSGFVSALLFFWFIFFLRKKIRKRL